MTVQEFSYLTNRIRGKLITLVQRFNRSSGREEDEEDIVQDALMTLWQLSEKGYPIKDAEALAVKITKTLCVERYRRQHIQFELMEDQPIPGGLSATARTEARDIETIRSIVQKDLTASQRQLLNLRNEEGLSLDEIATATGRPKGSIKVALSTARKKMKEKLKKTKWPWI